MGQKMFMFQKMSLSNNWRNAPFRSTGTSVTDRRWPSGVWALSAFCPSTWRPVPPCAGPQRWRPAKIATRFNTWHLILATRFNSTFYRVHTNFLKLNSMTFHTSNFKIPGSKIKNEYNFTPSIYYTTDYNYIYF